MTAGKSRWTLIVTFLMLFAKRVVVIFGVMHDDHSDFLGFDKFWGVIYNFIKLAPTLSIKHPQGKLQFETCWQF